MITLYLQAKDHCHWDNFVDSSPQGSIFCKTWYLEALQVSYEIMVVIEKNEIKAGIVLAKNEIKTYSNPIFDKYLGVLFSEYKGKQQKIFSKQYKYAEILLNNLKKIKSFDYYFHPNFINWIPFYWKNFTQQIKYTYIINNYEEDIKNIYSGFHRNLKNDIKSAKKKEVLIKKNISFEILYDLVDMTFLRQGSKAPFNKNKLKSFVNSLKKKNNFKSFGAFNDVGECIAVCGLVYEKENTAYLLFNGIDINKQIRGANALLLYESIIYFHDKCKYYDFEGSMLPGIEQFYRKFGGELTPYMRIWNDNIFNYLKSKAKKMYKKIRYGR